MSLPDMRGLPIAGGMRSGPDMPGLVVAMGLRSGPDMRGLPSDYGTLNVPLLDRYPGAVAAYSVARRLSSFANNPYRIARASDGALLDVGFAGGSISGSLGSKSGADADTTAALQFIGSSTGGISVLWDQAFFVAAGGADLLSSGTPLPQLINAGALNIEGRRPAMVFAGASGNGVLTSRNTNFGNDTGLNGNPAFSIFMVHKKTANASGCLMGWGNTGTALQAAGFYDDGVVANAEFAFAGGNAFFTSEPSTNAYYLSTFIKKAGAINANSASYRNEENVAVGGSSANTPNISGTVNLALGRWANFTSNQLLGTAQELIIYASDQSANRAGIEANIRAYYGM